MFIIKAIGNCGFFKLMQGLMKIKQATLKNY